MSTEIDWPRLMRRVRVRRKVRDYRSMLIVCAGCGRPCILCEGGCPGQIDDLLDRVLDRDSIAPRIKGVDE